MKRFVMTFIVLFVFCALGPSAVFAQDAAAATDTGLDMSQTSVSGIVSEVQKADRQISEITTQQTALAGQIDSLTAQASATKDEINALDAVMEAKKQELEGRLRAMYMFGSESYLEVLFSSEDLSDFFARADMIASILKADRGTMDEVKGLKAQIAVQTEALNSQNAMLAMAQQSSQYNQSTIDTLNNQRAQLLASNAEAQTAYDNIQNTVQSAKSNGVTSVSTGNSTRDINTSDFDLICAIVAHEGGTSYEGSLAVISCVMNRADSGRWGGTDPLSILTAPGQFASYFDGYYVQYLGADIPEVRQAVTDCIEGGIRSHPYTSFRSYETSGSVNICGNWYF